MKTLETAIRDSMTILADKPGLLPRDDVAPPASALAREIAAAARDAAAAWEERARRDRGLADHVKGAAARERYFAAADARDSCAADLRGRLRGLGL